MATAAPTESVQCFGRKKTAVAVTHCKRGRGLIKINGSPIELVEPEILRFKAYEPILLLGRHRFAGVDMRIRVKGGGHTSQIYAIRQSIAKALVAFYQKYVDEQSKKEIKDILVRYDRTLLVADPRRCETKKFGGRGARARFQKSYLHLVDLMAFKAFNYSDAGCSPYFSKRFEFELRLLFADAFLLRISVSSFPVNENELFSVAFKATQVFAGMLGLEPERWRERNGLGQSQTDDRRVGGQNWTGALCYL
ncbi:hypothetical protein NC653_003229 [Populus alba x Populus x berolinensis]|uniref:40S ribosomal protein S16 n=1 Tax=Populus alba x Populus x berolinensis TaxID=444605 RepID=A0AAD6WIW1_9ROSI|nr:hypothetical protein NC653_003229 [Populus alba x Populus x berolinensis]